MTEVLPFIYIFSWGYLIFSVLFSPHFKSSMPVLERLGLSYLLGGGFITLGLFLADYFGFSLSSQNILSLIYLGVLFLGIGSFFRNRGSWKGLSSYSRAFSFSPMKERIKTFFKHKINWFLLVLFLILLVQVVFVFLEAWIRPFFTWDDIETWGFKGKAIFETQRICWEYFHFSRPQYPLHLPLLQAFVSILIGEWNEAVVRTISSLYYVSLLSIFFCEIRRHAKPFMSFAAVLLLATLPELAFHATIAYADMTHGIYHSVGALFLIRWFRNKEKENLVFWGILGGFAIWTKLEGFLFFLAQCPIIAFYFYRTREWKQIKYFAIHLILPILFYFITRYVYRDHFPAVIDARLKTFGFYPERLNWVFRYFWESVLTQGTWSFLWAGFLFYPFKIRDLWKDSFNYPFLLFLSYLFCFFTMWTVLGTEEDIYYAYISAALNRILHSIIILLVFFHAIVFEKLLQQDFMIKEKLKPAWQSKGNLNKKRK